MEWQTIPPSKGGLVAIHISPIGIANCGEVTPFLYRGAQPDLKGSGIQSLYRLGVKQILDLRSEDDKTAHEELLQAQHYNLFWTRIPISNIEIRFSFPPWQTAAPSTEQAVQFLALLSSVDCAGPVFVHCKYGHDRTGAMIALYRRQIQNWSLDDTVAEMVDFGFNPKRHTVIYDWVKSLPLKELK